jgi:SAM-dependent methyltransferase
VTDQGSNRPEAGTLPRGPRRSLDQPASARASRHWWDLDAADYAAEHGEFLGDVDFVWCPEGLREADVGLLGPVSGLRVLEIGAGAAPCSRWLAAQAAHPVALDVSGGMLHQARVAAGRTRIAVPLLQADAAALPLADGAFDLACSAYGAVPFVADLARVHTEVARVLRPGGRWVFSVTHPVRWSFLDDPGPGGLVAVTSYFDRRAYVEEDERGIPAYVEHHHTIGDQVRALRGAGFRLDDVVEPEWPEGHERIWGGWSPTRGRLLPGTAIFVARLD